MVLTVQEPEPTLFGPGETLEAQMIASAGTARAVLVIGGRKGPGVQWITPADARREGLAVVEATERELGMLRGAGYALPVTGGGRAK
ncbi:MAG: hypothetical protein FJ288_11185 [Planctomycetes bacterium]|nr:hypothetical protein [Planctomycetota bacterium]